MKCAKVEMLDIKPVEESLTYVIGNTLYRCMPKLTAAYISLTAWSRVLARRTSRPPVFIENDTLECICSCLHWESEPKYFTRNPLFRMECLHVYVVTALGD